MSVGLKGVVVVALLLAIVVVKVAVVLVVLVSVEVQVVFQLVVSSFGSLLFIDVSTKLILFSWGKNRTTSIQNSDVIPQTWWWWKARGWWGVCECSR